MSLGWFIGNAMLGPAKTVDLTPGLTAGVIVCVVCVCMCFGVFKVQDSKDANGKDSSYKDIAMMGLLVPAVFGFAAFMCIYSIMWNFANPERYLLGQTM